MSDAPSYAAQLGDDLIRQAAAITDLNEACKLLQDAAGITDGGIAGIHFSGKCTDPAQPEIGDLLDWEEAWPLISVAEREAQLRDWLKLEDHFRETTASDPSVPVTGEPMTYLAAARDLKAGDVVISTGILDSYPTYFIEAGARFVVVSNHLDAEDSPALDIRLIPVDKALLKEGSLAEWGDCVQFYGPDWDRIENDPGVDPADRENPGNRWSKPALAIRKDNDALGLDHRLAAVFTYYLAQDAQVEMAEVVRRNAETQSDLFCSSHDFCDANMVMAEAMEHVLGRPGWMPYDWEEGRCSEGEHEADVALWNRAWDLAKTEYFLAYQKPDDAEEDTGSHYEALYSQRGAYWYVDCRDSEGGETVAGDNGELGLTEEEARQIASLLNQGEPLVLVLAARQRQGNPLAAPLLELLQYVGGWDKTDPEHPIVKARLAYQEVTGESLTGQAADLEFKPLTDTTMWRHCRNLGVDADYCILYQRAEGFDGWVPFATCAPETIELIRRDGVRAHADHLTVVKR